jgi:DNA-binding transcriptional LysR family regulator
MINLRQIEAFQAVMVAGSATGAAKSLFITQPAVSRLLSDLEHRLGFKLFIRRPNRLDPTPEAQTLYESVDKAFIGLQEIQRSADAIANKQQGVLHIVAMPVCVDSFMVQCVADFLVLYPNIKIELESAPRIQALDMVRSKRIVSLKEHEDAGLLVQQFCKQAAVCVLPASHKLCDLDVIHITDLQNERFISLSTGSPFRAEIDEMFNQHQVSRKVIIETRTQRTSYDLVKQGVGVAILDTLVTDALDQNIVIKPFVPAITWNYAVVSISFTQQSLIAKAFIELLIKRFSTFI